ncbi:hypothetical protein BJ508DRAFT_322407 [Ascobolus immersus RN42]|uniref:Uncharacterized protein n=1 Tax=Ascobolus immersus RN42 TaxID=1160509 RepID=A0A3N4II40_ASCIM|nr:hypothetical protein BJ508DRAFT_322407 [Ascobolus immersus RN42]
MSQNTKIQHLYSTLRARLNDKSTSGYTIQEITGINPQSPYYRTHILPTIPELPSTNAIDAEATRILAALSTLYDKGMLNPTTDFHINLRTANESRPTNPTLVLLLIAPAQDLSTSTKRLPEIFRIRTRHFSLNPNCSFADLDRVSHSQIPLSIPTDAETEALKVYLCEYHGEQGEAAARDGEGTVPPFIRMRHGFKPREDHKYPEYRRLLLEMLFPELVALVEEWIGVKIKLGNKIRLAMKEGHKREAEMRVRRFMEELEKGGIHYVLLEKIAFFMGVVCFLERGRAPSVDARIWAYLYGTRYK